MALAAPRAANGGAGGDGHGRAGGEFCYFETFAVAWTPSRLSFASRPRHRPPCVLQRYRCLATSGYDAVCLEFLVCGATLRTTLLPVSAIRNPPSAVTATQ
jgi:hypothetical protein